jgi:hypothetical protein
MGYRFTTRETGKGGTMRSFLVVEEGDDFYTCKMETDHNQAAVVLDDKELLIKAFLQWCDVPKTMIEDMILAMRT